MNGRVFVLIAATGLFIHVWNANHRPVSPETVEITEVAPTLEPTSPRLELSLDAATNEAPVRQTSVPVREVAAETKKNVDEDLLFEKRYEPIVRSKAAPSVSSLWIEPALLPERLPQGMAAGLYQVVDNFGHVTLAQITAERLAESGVVSDTVVRDLYVHQSGNQRWYFIRQGDIGESQPAVPMQPIPSAVTKSGPEAKPTALAATRNPVPAPQGEATEGEVSTPLLMGMVRSHVARRQKEMLIERVNQKLIDLGEKCLSAVPDAAKNAGAESWMTVTQTVERISDRMLQRIPGADALMRSVDWTFPMQEVQELPTVAVPGMEVELPSIPLRTVRQPQGENVPPR